VLLDGKDTLEERWEQYKVTERKENRTKEGTEKRQVKRKRSEKEDRKIRSDRS
jgi:hypothetical protein